MVNPNLPYEIVIDILSRLPVKPLIRCKCVCKSLRSLISNPTFVKTHLNRSLIASNIDHQGLFINSNSLYTRNTISTREVDYIPLPIQGSFTVGSCNGLVCILLDPNNFVLLNPSTREYNHLPSPCRFPKNGLVFVGFGYDSITDDYKVLKGAFLRASKKSMAEVFSLKANTWKRVQEIPCYFVFQFPGPLLNGALHWDAMSVDNIRNLIVSFDLAEEKFAEVPLPFDEDHKSALTVGVLEGCLCMTRNYNGDGGIEIWIMKEYGVRESWTKLVNVACLGGIKNYFFPLYYMKNILLQIHRDQLAIYNPKEDSLTMIEVPGNQEFQVVTYVESLVMPQGDSEGQKRGRRGHGGNINTSWKKRTWYGMEAFTRLALSRHGQSWVGIWLEG